METLGELEPATTRWLIALPDADPGIDCAGKAMATTNPRRAGAAAIDGHLEMRNCAGFLR